MDAPMLGGLCWHHGHPALLPFTHGETGEGHTLDPGRARRLPFASYPPKFASTFTAAVGEAHPIWQWLKAAETFWMMPWMLVALPPAPLATSSSWWKTSRALW